MLSNPFVAGKFSLEQFPGEDSWGTQWTVGGQKRTVGGHKMTVRDKRTAGDTK